MANPAMAQDAANADRSAVAGTTGSGNPPGEIVVTARKKTETLIEVPVAITALSGEDLNARNITDYSSLADFSPGLRFQNQSVNRNDRGYTFFTMRGMFSGTPSPDRQGASAFIDGVPVGSGSISGLTDIAQVEVIRGPQSAYFGRATFSGAINFITRDPGFEPRMSGTVSYGSYNTVEGRISAEIGLVPDLLAARVSGRIFHTDGQYDNFGVGGKLGAQDTRSVSGTLLFTPSADLKIKAFLNYWEDDDGPPASGQLLADDNNCTTVTGRSYYCGALETAPRNRMVQQTYVTSSLDRVNDGVVLGDDFVSHFGVHREAIESHVIADYDLGGGYTVGGNVAYFRDRWGYVTDTGFRDGRSMVNPFYAANNTLVPYFSRTVGGQTELTNKSAEIRVASPSDDRLNWLVGFNYFRQRNSITTNAFSNSGFSAAVPATTYSADTYGIFGSLGFDITEQLNLSLEGRYQWDEIGQVVPVRSIDYSGQSKSFNPRAILRYSFSPDASVYASYAKGTRPGQFNATLLALPQVVQDQVQSQLDVPTAVGPEKIEMGELGFKSAMFDRRLRIQLAAYYGKWYDKHINQNITYSNPTPQTVRVVVPGGKVRLYGVEFEGSLKVTDALTLEGTLSYAQTDIRNTQCAECLALTGNANPVGNRLPQYSAWTGSASIDYRQPVSSAFEGYMRADYIYVGRQYESEANLAWTAPAHRVNLRLGVDDGKFSFELYGENIFDDKTPTSIAYNSDTYTGVPAVTFSPARRRVFGGRVGFEF